MATDKNNRLFLIRILASLGVGLSLLLLWEYLGSEPSICTEGGGCAKVKDSAWAYPLGIPLPAIGAAAFAGLFALSWMSAAYLAFLRIGAFIGGALALVFLGVQYFSIGVFCKFCVIIDIIALSMALVALDLQSLKGPQGQRGVVIAFSAALAVAPLLWGTFSGGGLTTATPTTFVSTDLVKKWQKPGVLTVVEFLDFKCPICRKLHTELSPALQEFPNEVRLVRMHLPVHRGSDVAAKACMCAEKKGKGDAMADRLVDLAVDDINKGSCIESAREIGMDVGSFVDCLDSAEMNQRLQSDRSDALALQISGVPTFFIGNERIVGSKSKTWIVEKIGDALARMKEQN